MWRTLAVALAVFSSVAAMGQQKKDGETDWMKDFTSRITLNGYAQGGWSYQDPNGKKTNAYNLKRTLLWAKARITDRWSTKPQIAAAVEKKFGVHVLKVRTVNVKGGLRYIRGTRRATTEATYKKAYVTVKAGERIEQV